MFFFSLYFSYKMSFGSSACHDGVQRHAVGLPEREQLACQLPGQAPRQVAENLEICQMIGSMDYIQ